MTRRLVVSARAEVDLEEIWVYSFQLWGEARADRYLEDLGKGLRECGARPERGRCRDDVRTGYWSRLLRRHVVFYTFDDEEVLIRRVLHGSMDPDQNLDHERE